MSKSSRKAVEGADKWPPTQVELIADLERLRKPGLLKLDTLDLPALCDAAVRTGWLIGDMPDVVGLLRAAAESLGKGPAGTSAVELFGLDPDWSGLPHGDRVVRAAEPFGVGAQRYARAHRPDVVRALASEILRLVIQSVKSSSSEQGNASGYSSAFSSWDEVAWVRKKSRNEDPFDRNLDFFSRALVPLLDLPQSVALTPHQQEEILVHHLYNYLEFTVQLETGPVNEICAKIRDKPFLDWLPSGLKDDALRIYTDEGGHAEMSNDLKRRVQDFTGIEPVRSKPQFLTVLNKLHSERLRIEQDFITLIFVIVSETLITGSLNKLPKDSRVQTAVRKVAKDHAADEGRHHKYFSEVLSLVWPRLPHPLKFEVVEILPRLIRAFLDIDRRAVAKIVRLYPDVYPDAGQTVADLCDLPSVRNSIEKSAEPTVRIMKSAGVLSTPGAVGALASSGLLKETA